MSMIQHDIELGYADVQALSDADAVAVFFERLGYNTSVRRIQTPANLEREHPLVRVPGLGRRKSKFGPDAHRRAAQAALTHPRPKGDAQRLAYRRMRQR